MSNRRWMLLRRANSCLACLCVRCDYLTLARLLLEYLSALTKAGMVPVVIMDGMHDKAKMKTTLDRRRVQVASVVLSSTLIVSDDRLCPTNCVEDLGFWICSTEIDIVRKRCVLECEKGNETVSKRGNSAHERGGGMRGEGLTATAKTRPFGNPKLATRSNTNTNTNASGSLAYCRRRECQHTWN